MIARPDRTILTPASEAVWLAYRVQDVTSTQSAALFGQSPYGTEFELWNAKRDKTDVLWTPNEAMEWGTELQESIARVLSRRYGVEIVPMREYIRLERSRMGASFDFKIVGIRTGVEGVPVHDRTLQAMFNNYGPGIFEIKNVDRFMFRRDWERRDEDTGEVRIEPPGHIDIQVQHQLHVAGLLWSAIGFLIGGNRGKVLTRLAYPDVGNALEARIAKFWKTVDENTPPPPCYPEDADIVSALYSHAEPGRLFDARGNEELNAAARAYREASDRETLAKEDKKVAHAKILMGIGEAERATFDDFTLWAGAVGPAHVEYDRKGFRGFKLTARKPEKEKKGKVRERA